MQVKCITLSTYITSGRHTLYIFYPWQCSLGNLVLSLTHFFFVRCDYSSIRVWLEDTQPAKCQVVHKFMYWSTSSTSQSLALCFHCALPLQTLIQLCIHMLHRHAWWPQVILSIKWTLIVNLMKSSTLSLNICHSYIFIIKQICNTTMHARGLTDFDYL